MCCNVELHPTPQLGLRPGRRLSLYTFVPHHWSCAATNITLAGSIENVIVKRSTYYLEG